MDGVLKSWAIPKGPSLDPADKRLAMQVEDHPVSYFDFEGTIPEGNYGAGTVMVWDVGTWEPQGDAHQMLAKGDLKFRLNGKKLKGDFALVHMKSRRPGNKGTEWLLIKHRDAYDQPGYDIDKYDYSALTKRTLKQIAGDEGSAEWLSSRKASVRGGSAKNDWLAESIAKADARKAKVKKSSAAKPPSIAARTTAFKRTGKPASATRPEKDVLQQPTAGRPAGKPGSSAAVKKKSQLTKTA
jgi:bifunctional non-homologous end joining protein LigD